MPLVPVTLADILTYVTGKSRPLIEGEAVFKAGHIISCQVKNLDNREIFALCLQTSTLQSPLHEVKLTLGNLETSPDKWLCVCSCKAGQSGFCKHVIATLIYVNRHEELDVGGENKCGENLKKMLVSCIVQKKL